MVVGKQEEGGGLKNTKDWCETDSKEHSGSQKRNALGTQLCWLFSQCSAILSEGHLPMSTLTPII